jgi:MATE family multidrug resistance protein
LQLQREAFRLCSATQCWTLTVVSCRRRAIEMSTPLPTPSSQSTPRSAAEERGAFTAVNLGGSVSNGMKRRGANGDIPDVCMSPSQLPELPRESEIDALVSPASLVVATPLNKLLFDVLSLAVPITVSTAAQFSVVTVNLSFVGRLGVAELGGAATGVMITNSTAFAVATGLCGALDTVLSQIHGANPNDRRYGRETQRMVCILFLFAVPISFLWWNIASVLNSIHQPPEIVAHTSTFVRTMLPGLPAIMGLEVLKRYMQAQHVTTPITVAVFTAAVANPLVLGVCMDGLGLKFAGAAVGWNLVLWGMCIGLLGYLLMPSNATRCAMTWSGWEWGSALSGWKPLLRLGLPCLGITLAEWTTFELNGVAASFTNPTDLAAYSITNQIATLAWTVISGLASAICVVVGNAVGASNHLEARRCAIIGATLVTCLAFVNALIILTNAPRLAAIFTDEPAVHARVGDLAPILATYQMLDSLVTVVNAIARGIGRQRFVALFTSFSLLCLGVPIGMTMAFKFGHGVGWLMLGPTCGIGLSLCVYAVWFWRLNWRDVVPTIDAKQPATRDV